MLYHNYRKAVIVTQINKLTSFVQAIYRKFPGVYVYIYIHTQREEKLD